MNKKNLENVMFIIRDFLRNTTSNQVGSKSIGYKTWAQLGAKVWNRVGNQVEISLREREEDE